jgi:hypothetical protein
MKRLSSEASLGYEFFGRGESNTAVAASDHGYFILQFPHQMIPLFFSGLPQE